MTTTSSIINIQVNKDTQPVSRASQTYPLILTEHTAFSERARVYTSLDSVEDDFPSGTTTWKMASGVFGQAIVPERIVIGRKQVDGVSGTVTVANTAVYTITLNGEAATFTSDSSALATEIVAGLKIAVDALAEAGVTFTNNLDGTFDITVTAGLAWSVKSTANITLVNDVLTETWVQAKSAVQNENNSWYALLASTHVKNNQQLLAAAIEAERKIYITSTNDNTAGTVATTDIGSILKALSYERTAVIWSGDADNSFPECGWAGRQLQDVPGSNDWCYKEIVGTLPDSLNDTASTYLHDKNYTTYETLDGVNRTVGGDMAKDTPIDEVVFIDWMVINIRADLWQMFANIRKVPYDKNGFTMIESKIRGVNSRGIANGGITETPAPQVIMPVLASIPTIDKANRHLPGIVNNITLAGSIRTVSIVINVSL